MPIHTVLGPISPDLLGPTDMHEHLFIDCTLWYQEPTEAMPESDRVIPENLAFLRWNIYSLKDNLVVDDPELVARELRFFQKQGGSGIVDLTIDGLGPRVADLPPLAERLGLHIMVGCGFYVDKSHPRWLVTATVDDVSGCIIEELNEGIADTKIRPALIGEIGTSDPVTDRERKVLTAAGQAATQSGAALNVHLTSAGTHALDILDVLTGEGMEPGRVIFSHLDEKLDWGYHSAIAQAGAVLEYDTFGYEGYQGLARYPNDTERMEWVARLVEEGFADQLVLGCDAGCKAQLKAYGGGGYEHLLKRIVPALTDRHGVETRSVEKMIVTTPRRLLNRP